MTFRKHNGRLWTHVAWPPGFVFTRLLEAVGASELRA